MAKRNENYNLMTVSTALETPDEQLSSGVGVARYRLVEVC